jgi:hypothetical protein
MSRLDRAKMLDLIERNIQRSGFHLYIVGGGSVPRFAYTIGLRESLGAELVVAGAVHYLTDDLLRIVHSIRGQLENSARFDSVVSVDGLGRFALRRADRTWVRPLLLGALDYYKVGEVDAYQIVPDEVHWTIDTPDMAREWSAVSEPIWRWLHEPWGLQVPPKSTATTNLDALRGARITEATRWEEDYWEMFAGPGPEVSREDTRVVPLGCLLSADPSLSPVIDLEVGEGLWRDEGGAWNAWRTASEQLSDPEGA